MLLADVMLNINKIWIFISTKIGGIVMKVVSLVVSSLALLISAAGLAISIVSLVHKSEKNSHILYKKYFKIKLIVI